MGAIRLITLDVTNTLIKVRNGVEGMYKHVAAKQGLECFSHVPSQQIASGFKNSFRSHWSKAPNFGYGNIPAVEWWDNVTKDTLQYVGVELEPTDLTSFCEALYHTFATGSAYELIPGAKQTVEAISSKLDIVVITNNDSRIRSVLKELFDPGAFNQLIISNEVGFYKPDTRLFTKVIEGRDVSANQVLHIGDSYENDYVPAVSLGMKAILFTPTNTSYLDCKTITDITQVLQFI